MAPDPYWFAIFVIDCEREGASRPTPIFSKEVRFVRIADVVPESSSFDRTLNAFEISVAPDGRRLIRTERFVDYIYGVVLVHRCRDITLCESSHEVVRH